MALPGMRDPTLGGHRLGALFPDRRELGVVSAVPPSERIAREVGVFRGASKVGELVAVEATEIVGENVVRISVDGRDGRSLGSDVEAHLAVRLEVIAGIASTWEWPWRRGGEHRWGMPI